MVYIFLMGNVNKSISVLIIGFRRIENICKILDVCVSAGVQDFYISLDGLPSIECEPDTRKTQILNHVQNINSKIKVQIEVRNRNLGCAVNVLTSCDWFFQQEEFGIVLEDDCVPHPSFIQFSLDCQQLLLMNSDVLLFGGSQFDRKIEKAGIIFKSKYALTWGWGTNRENWNILVSYIRDGFVRLKINEVFDYELRFWKSGARRAYQGYTDVWDTILQYQLIQRNKYCYLPEKPLIKNIGFDEFATHTKLEPYWSDNLLEPYMGYCTTANSSEFSISFLRNNVFAVAKKHLFSTIVRSITDKFTRKKFSEPLLVRWDKYKL